uniref:Uncharacterized protein n=1 Tax=Triticum urartu TaxID=4572 RepID=A0A8R7VHM0_TRIUA
MDAVRAVARPPGEASRAAALRSPQVLLLLLPPLRQQAVPGGPVQRQELHREQVHVRRAVRQRRGGRRPRVRDLHLRRAAQQGLPPPRLRMRCALGWEPRRRLRPHGPQSGDHVTHIAAVRAKVLLLPHPFRRAQDQPDAVRRHGRPAQVQHDGTDPDHRHTEEPGRGHLLLLRAAGGQHH